MDRITIHENLFAKILELLSYNKEQPMIFSSGVFLLLFCCFIAIYCALRRRDNLRILYVIAFSLYFYYKSSGFYLLLLLFSAGCDYIIGRSIAYSISYQSRRLLVALSVAINLGMLFYFKYTNFFIQIYSDLFGDGFLDFQNIFLPVGISFFVFQSMSYTIDIFRGKVKLLHRFSDYLFYLSFFPQLVAGPIVRAKDFLPQIRKPLHLTREMMGTAVFLIVTGLFKKAIISDYISLNFVDRVFDQPLLYSGFESLMAIYGYALQIYCDFSGYSDMAIGLALILGFTFPKNFDAPYKSVTITEFWRRWHISLSSWLRDYLYISLGGNRKGKIRTYVNLLITMVLGGLWHGAAIRFILWGALHGVALALHKVWLSYFPNAKSDGKQMDLWPRIAGIFLTFNLVCFGWLLFRADSMETVGLMLHQIVYDFNLAIIPQFISGYKVIIAILILGYTLHFLPSRYNDWACQKLIDGGFALQLAVTVFMIWCVMQMQSSEIQPFIYFQF
ncbi:MAG: MBOAT family O-acyltransferase [Rikenellaceae bacterium]